MNFFYGRYGFDVLSLFLLLVSSLLNFGRRTSTLGMLLNIFVIYRAFSRNTYKRSMELNTFVGYTNRLLGRFGKSLPYNLPKITMDGIPQAFYILKNTLSQSMKYKIVKCPNCNQKLRLPRGQKKIIVTCTRCKHEFKMRT